jgi:NAD(P)-dependent dehydrogenase (short-subunit alcohol dehydrogenase family)
MNKKTVLITGANKGIGFETARELGVKGFIVLLGARDEERGKKAEAQLIKEGIDAHLILFDVTKQQSIDEAAGLIEREFGSLDVLVNNAGISL